MDNECTLIAEADRLVGTHLVETLARLLRCHGHLGGFDAMWQAYAYEIGLEELLHGQPRCPEDIRYSAALGSSSVHWNSSSRSCGFMSLGPWTACTVEGENTTPPLHHWLGNNTYLMVMVRRLWCLVDSTRAADHVFGRELLLVLLKDLFASNQVEEYLKDLHSSTSSMPKARNEMVGPMTYEVLVDGILTHLKHFRKSGVFDRAVCKKKCICSRNILLLLLHIVDLSAVVVMVLHRPMLFLIAWPLR